MTQRIRAIATVVAALACVSCDVQRDASVNATAASTDTSATANKPDSAAAPTSHTNLLIPARAGIERVGDLVRDPSRDTTLLPADAHVAQMIRRGRDIMRDTRKYAPKLVGNDLSCANCHLNAGQKDAAWPLVGVATLFPQYRARSGRLITLEDRIRDCFERSLNGVAPAFDSEELLAVSAYITWLSSGLPAGKEPAWRGRNTLAKNDQIAIEKLDVNAGRLAFERNCSACHGTNGAGVRIANAKPGPLWGSKSWNDGAGAARVYTLAGFIRHAMPLTAPGSLSNTDALNIAAFIESKDRPRFARKAADYPDGKIPVDAVYYPGRYAVNPLRK